MKEEAITSLAREYAEENAKRIRDAFGLPERAYYTDRDKDEKSFENVICFLLRRFCLVEKSKVKEECKRAIETNRKGKETGVYSLCTMGSARKVLLESIFPDLGKEVEG